MKTAAAEDDEKRRHTSSSFIDGKGSFVTPEVTFPLNKILSQISLRGKTLLKHLTPLSQAKGFFSRCLLFENGGIFHFSCAVKSSRASIDVLKAQLVRSGTAEDWGVRLEGGVDVGSPLTISRVCRNFYSVTG